jgi:hypothetical protein
MSALSLLAFFVSLFGIRFAFRIADKMSESRLINRKLRLQIQIGVPILIFIGIVTASKLPLVAWLFVCALLICLVMSQSLIRKHREQRFRHEFLDYLERVILLVRTGKPFRLALTNACDDMSPFTHEKLGKILEFVFFSQHSELNDTDSFSREIVRELIVIDRASHRCLDRLVVLRRNLRLESEFSLKAGQVVRRLRWQAYILSGLYFALATFMISQFQFADLWPYLWVSVTFFVTGLVWIVASGRKIKWKI